MFLNFNLFLILFSFCFKPFETPSYKLIIFEGSDWCPNCRRLDNNVLNQGDFKKFLQKHAIILEKIDFPQRKKVSPEKRKYNESVAEKYNFKGNFPEVIIVENKTGKFHSLNYANETAEKLIIKITATIERFK